MNESAGHSRVRASTLTPGVAILNPLGGGWGDEELVREVRVTSRGVELLCELHGGQGVPPGALHTVVVAHDSTVERVPAAEFGRWRVLAGGA